jgi:N-sulfoglucosamine sulfohydrolase
MRFENIIRLLLLFSLQVTLYQDTPAQVEGINVVLLMAEDINPHLGCYGDKLVHTPAIDRLAEGGIKYTKAYTVAGVCAPSRASIVTGMYSTLIGTQHMRQAKSHTPYEGIPFYNAVPPPYVKAFPEYLRAAGYFCSNNNKTDYQFGTPFTIWDSHSRTASWRDRPSKEQNFFACFTFQTTHEINVWPDEIKNKFYKDFNTDTTQLDHDAKYRPKLDKKYFVNPNDIILPPYYPDDSIVRSDVARHYTNISRMDTQVAEILDKLKEDGLDRNTIIFFVGDNGDGLPRAKRSLYDSGINVPLIMYIPQELQVKYKELRPGTSNQLISMIDLAPTILSLMGVNIPTHMQGKAFAGNQKSKLMNKYIYAARDRMDNRYDIIRAISDGRYKYIKNFQPEINYTQQLDFMYMMPMMQQIIKLNQENKLTEVQSYWLFKNKPQEELYDTSTDPYEIKNLANNKKHRALLKKMRKELFEWQKENDPYLNTSELNQANLMWPSLNQPTTNPVTYKIIDGKLHLSCSTDGASIGYSKSGENKWHLYQTPIPLQYIDVKAIRYGYKVSQITRIIE